MLAQGTNEIQSSITLPSDAADGNYRVTTTVEPLAVPNAAKEQASTAFVVSAGARPAATPGEHPTGRRPRRRDTADGVREESRRRISARGPGISYPRGDHGAARRRSSP